MKTVFTPIVMTLAFLTLAACGADGEPETPEAAGTAPASEEVPVDAGI